MMIYRGLSPWPNERAMVTYPLVWWDGAFTNDEIDTIVDYCEGDGVERATTLGGGDLHIRCSQVKFHKWSAETKWIFDKLNAAIDEINARWYGFALNGYSSFQYTTYNASEQGHYDWHMDMVLGNDCLPSEMIEPRKLSLTMLLNEPGKDFKGGDFEINPGMESGARTAECRKGRIIAFPSWTIHRVTPLTEGVRRSAVVWVTGPKFT